jgi:hypothetical protein
MKLAVCILSVFAMLACCYWVVSHYFIRTDEGMVVLEKRYITLANTYVDVRGWAVSDFEAHPRIEKALVAQGYAEVPKAARERERKENVDATVESAKELGRELGKALDDFLRELEKKLSRGRASAGKGGADAEASPAPPDGPQPPPSPAPGQAAPGDGPRG